MRGVPREQKPVHGQKCEEDVQRAAEMWFRETDRQSEAETGRMAGLVPDRGMTWILGLGSWARQEACSFRSLVLCFHLLRLNPPFCLKPVEQGFVLLRSKEP